MENSFIIGRDVIRDQTNIPIPALWCYPGSLSLSDFLILSYRDLGADADDCFSGLRNKSPRTKNERRRHASLDLSTLIPPPPPPPAVYWFPFLLSFLHTCSQCAAMNCIVGFVRQPPSFLPPLERIGFTQGTPVKFVEQGNYSSGFALSSCTSVKVSPIWRNLFFRLFSANCLPDTRWRVHAPKDFLVTMGI